jgi:hypothetical protein
MLLSWLVNLFYLTKVKKKLPIKSFQLFTAHEAGLATLQVACDGFVISNTVIFEYKLPPREERVTAPEPKVEPASEGLLKFTLLHRLEAMDDKLQIKQEPDGVDSVIIT